MNRRQYLLEYSLDWWLRKWRYKGYAIEEIQAALVRAANATNETIVAMDREDAGNALPDDVRDAGSGVA